MLRPRLAITQRPRFSMSSLKIAQLFGVAGKTALVTGGGQGIGAMITAALVQNGANVFITSRKADVCAEAAKEFTAMGPGTCTALPEDLGTTEGCLKAVEALKERTDKLNILVNNAGTTWGEPLESYSDQAWSRVFDLNVKAVFTLTRATLPLLDAASAPEDPGRVINIGSVAGIMPQPIPSFAYDASKAAVHMLTRKLATELADRREKGGNRITVNAIAPGFVPSKMSAQLLTYAGEEKIASSVPLGRLGTTEDLGGTTVFLASRAAAWITGAIIPVDGGTTARPMAMADFE